MHGKSIHTEVKNITAYVLTKILPTTVARIAVATHSHSLSTQKVLVSAPSTATLALSSKQEYQTCVNYMLLHHVHVDNCSRK